jgi:ATP-dependent Zn protease
MKKLFADARSMAPCIIFIDEIDAIGGREKVVPSFLNPFLTV